MRFKFSLGDYDIGHSLESETNSEMSMVEVAVHFSMKYCGESTIEVDYENNWLILGVEQEMDEDFEACDNFLEDGRYIIGSFEIM